MKKTKLLNALLAIGCCIASFTFTSCLDDDGDEIAQRPMALVTTRHTSSGQFYLQLDEKQTLYPENLKTSPYGKKQVRALIIYDELDKQTEGFTKTVNITKMDSILTKSMVPSVSVEDDKKYGTDPIEIIKDWVTLAEDDYLTLRVRVGYGIPSTKHALNLISGVNPDNPYEVTLCHNAFGDLSGNITGPYADALVAFDLSTLPDTKGETVKLKVNWKSFSGNKSAEFDYCSRQNTLTMKAKSTEQVKFIDNIK